MDVSAEAKRIMVQALGKMYSSRNQRGGLSLHRSLLLTLVMKAARDVYHSVRVVDTTTATQDTRQPAAADRLAETDEPMETCAPPTPDSPVTDKENCHTTGLDTHSRKRRSKLCSEPEFLPCKKAKLDIGEVRRVLQDTAARTNSGQCAREIQTSALIPRTVATC